MKRFVFRAQAALDLRQREEDEATRALLAAESRERAALEAWMRATADMEASLRRARDVEGEASAIAPRLWHRNWIAALRQVIDRCALELEQRRAEVADATARRVDAARRRKSLERLRERALARWQDEARREEQKAIDELATVRFVRNRAAGGQL